MRLRRFNDDGVEQFRHFLSQSRENANIAVPTQLLTDESLTELIEPEILVEQRTFKNKESAAVFFHERFSKLSVQQLSSDAGLWSWLSLLYFDQICPFMHGRRSVKNDYTYIFEPNNSRNYYRHLLWIAWRVLDVAPTHNRLLLQSPIVGIPKVTTEVMKRLYLTRIPCIFEVLDRLYWDEGENRPKKGIVGSKVVAGNLTHRLPIRLRQLEKTYDLFSLNANQLVELLGDEFNGALAARS